MRTLERKTYRLGTLMTRVTAELPGPEHYTIKRNVRRDVEAETTREGDILFAPNDSLPVGNQPYPAGAAGGTELTDHEGVPLLDQDDEPLTIGGEPITRIVNLRHPNGKTAVIACTPTAIYRFFALDDGAVYAAEGPDTPVYATSGDDTPVYDDNPGEWILIGRGFSPAGHLWEAEVVDGTLVLNNGIDLPVRYRLNQFEVTPLYELREAGVAAVETIWQVAGVLMCGDITEIRADRMAEVMNGDRPYGPVTDPGLVNRVQYKIVWPGLAAVDRWRASVRGSIAAGSDKLTLAWPMRSLRPGDSIVISGAGPDGGNLVTTIQYLSGTAVNLVDFASTASAEAIVQKSDAGGLLAGSYLLQGDGSAILRGFMFKGRVVVMKATGIFVGDYTGDAANPFVFEPEVYHGPMTLFWKWAACVVLDEWILMAGREEFYEWDLVNRVPRVHRRLAQVSDLFYTGASSELMDRAWVADMRLTNEVWIHLPLPAGPDRFICYDYKQDDPSTIDADYTAAATIDRPVAGAQPATPELWGALGLADGTVLQYGLTQSGLEVFTRSGRDAQPLEDDAGEAFEDDAEQPITLEAEAVAYESVLRGGYFSPGGALDEGKVCGYQPILASNTPRPTPVVEFRIHRLRTTAEADMPREIGRRALDPGERPHVPLDAKGAFFVEQLNWSGRKLRLTGRVWMTKPVPSRGSLKTDGPA